MWGYRATPVMVPGDPTLRCCDGIPPQFLTCQGKETRDPEPYLLKVLGDSKPVIMCEAHRADSQRDADEALINHSDIKFPRYKE